MYIGAKILKQIFLSTLSLRRATFKILGTISATIYFYPRSPCGERRLFFYVPKQIEAISIHALLAESDMVISVFVGDCNISIHALLAESDILSVGGVFYGKSISIHALLAESDRGGDLCYLDNIDFYPRSPCGERPLLYTLTRCASHFYPRSPCGERLTD